MFTPASFGLRLGAFIIDVILMSIFRGVLMFLFMAIGWLKNNTPEQDQLLQDMAINKATPETILGATAKIALDNGQLHFFAYFYLLSVVIFVVFIVIKGGTPGKLALGLRIQDINSKTNPKWLNALLRETIGKIISSIMLLGFLFPLFRKDKRALHDLVAQTQVIKKATT
jgi:uncharacterized RDD family membrane protein YckC